MEWVSLTYNPVMVDLEFGPEPSLKEMVYKYARRWNSEEKAKEYVEDYFKLLLHDKRGQTPGYD